MKTTPAHRVAYKTRVAFTDALDQLVLSEIDSIANEQRQRRVRQRSEEVPEPLADTAPQTRDILEPNELAFIDRVVSWVYARPHREAILAEIEARLFESADTSPGEETAQEIEQEEIASQLAVGADAPAEVDPVVQ